VRDRVSVDSDCQRSRWVAHLDLLGASSLVESNSWIHVFSIYSHAIERFRQEAFDEHLIERITFSDSFILYTVDDSAVSYRALDSFCRHFIVKLIRGSVPVRGAMACGEFYADPSSSLYFGKALLEAYRLGESQDWIGFALSGSARDRLAEVGLPANERLNYAMWDIPLKRNAATDKSTVHLPALILALSPGRSQVESTVDSLRTLQSQALSDTVRRKYENTVQFLQKNIREPAG
jgi:hypothetical protein